MTFVVNLAPAPLQIRAAALSIVYPRRPNTPARKHAANGSIWRPHWHARDVRGRGRRKRRKRRILNNCGSSCNRGHVGTHDNGRPASTVLGGQGCLAACTHTIPQPSVMCLSKPLHTIRAHSAQRLLGGVWRSAGKARRLRTER